MRHQLLIAAFMGVLTTMVFVGVASAQIQPVGGFGSVQVTSEPPTTVATSTDSYFANDGFFSLFFSKFRGWGTSVVARPAYRTPALVLRERVGMNKTR